MTIKCNGVLFLNVVLEYTLSTGASLSPLLRLEDNKHLRLCNFIKT